MLARKMFHILGDQTGGAVLVFFLLIIFLLVSTWFYQLTNVQITTVSDAVVLQALQIAVRSAAGQITSDSMAMGNPRIDVDKANSVFQRELADNLRLDQSTLTPNPGSMVMEPEYSLVVYNVDDTYSSSGAPAGKIYNYSGGSTISQYFYPMGSSYLFGVNPADITPGISGPINCTLKCPGVVASITVKMQSVAGNNVLSINRWVAAKVVVQ